MERLHVQLHGEPPTHTAPLELCAVEQRIHPAG
jgi:putative GTP pyrophosphokinase